MFFGLRAEFSKKNVGGRKKIVQLLFFFLVYGQKCKKKMSGVRIKKFVKILIKCCIGLPLYGTTDEQSCQRRLLLLDIVRENFIVTDRCISYDRVTLTKFNALNLFSWIPSPSPGLLV